MLNAGGSYVSYSDATREQLTIVIETAGAAVVGFAPRTAMGNVPSPPLAPRRMRPFFSPGWSLPTTMALRRTRPEQRL